MVTNLFSHQLATPSWELEPAAIARLHTRSLWTEPSNTEDDAPERRIIHSRAIFADEPLALESFRVQQAAGYHKCASGQERDAALDVLLRVPSESGWDTIAEINTTADDVYDTGVDIDLGGLQTTGLVAEIRRAATDGWWPGWNLASTGLVLTGEPTAPWRPQPQGRLDLERLDLHQLPQGVEAEHRNSEVRFTTPFLKVGFRLINPAWSYLSVDADGGGATHRNLLQLPRSMDIVRSGVYPSGVYPVLRDQNAEYLAQGPRFTAHHGERSVGFLATDFHGTTTVDGNVVRYEVTVPGADQHYSLTFTVLKDRILLSASRRSTANRRAWTSSVWHMATDNRVTPSSVLGDLTFEGETGILRPEALLHFPRYGSLKLNASGDALWRSDSVRPLDTNTLELKLGEQPTALGDYVLPAGEFSSDIEFVVATPRLAALRDDTPDVVARMLDRHAVTALPFRADTATYSNNGASMHCATSLNDVSAIAVHLDPVVPDTHPMDWVGVSLERWLTGAPSYGSGETSHGPHRLDDEYVHLAANTLTALGRFLTWSTDAAWYLRNRARILREVEWMLARDLDGDGLVESAIRRGVSGEHQWSTGWADVISFGGKDAWANASLFDAWGFLAPVLAAHGEAEISDRIITARQKLQSAYLPAFYNPETGLIAGWVSVDGEMHDYGFSLVNGAACASELLPVAEARAIMTSLVEVWEAVGIQDLRNGLPLNAWRIPEKDIGGVIFGLPMGNYQQGGMSHHGARVVVDALHRVGLTEKSKELLLALSETIADDSSFGGLGSGVDWRMWDGTPSGYEGQLVEGFSVLASALARYRDPGVGL